MGRTNRDTGDLGEKIAEKFLVSRGYKILSRNFPTPFGEIDLIAKKNGCTVFLEIKTRISEKFGPPASAVTRAKQKHIIKNCQYYLKGYGLNDAPCRIDVIGICLDPRGKVKILRHIKNAVELHGHFY